MSIALAAAGVWVALSIPAALVLGRAIRLADQRTTTSPPAARVGEEPRRRGLHVA